MIPCDFCQCCGVVSGVWFCVLVWLCCRAMPNRANTRNFGFLYKCQLDCVRQNVSVLITSAKELCKVCERFLGQRPFAEGGSVFKCDFGVSYRFRDYACPFFMVTSFERWTLRYHYLQCRYLIAVARYFAFANSLPLLQKVSQGSVLLRKASFYLLWPYHALFLKREPEMSVVHCPVCNQAIKFGAMFYECSYRF